MIRFHEKGINGEKTTHLKLKVILSKWKFNRKFKIGTVLDEKDRRDQSGLELQVQNRKECQTWKNSENN